MYILQDSTSNYMSVEKCDLVNYYGLSHGKQIILCVHRKKDYRFLICPLKKPRNSEDNELSEEGNDCRSDLSRYPLSQSRYFLVNADLFDVKNNDIKMWEQLYSEGLFPYWKPKEGPFDFHEKKTGQVAFCYVEEVEMPTSTLIPLVEEARANAKIRDEMAVHEIVKAIKRPVLLPSEYNRVREKVFEIMSKNISPSET